MQAVRELLQGDIPEGYSSAAFKQVFHKFGNCLDQLDL
jgi:hypothetical protein